MGYGLRTKIGTSERKDLVKESQSKATWLKMFIAVYFIIVKN